MSRTSGPRRDLDAQRLLVSGRPAREIVCERLSTRSESLPAARVRTRSCITPSTTLGAPTSSTARRRTMTLIVTGRALLADALTVKRARLAEAVRDLRAAAPPACRRRSSS